MTKMHWAMYVKAYNALLCAHHMHVHEMLYRDQAYLFEGAQQKSVIDFVCERFGFLMILDQTINVLQNSLHDLEDEFDENEDPAHSAFKFISSMLKRINEASSEPSYIENLNTFARDQLGLINETALASGHELCLNWLEERIEDYLDIVPIESRNNLLSISSSNIHFEHRLHKLH